MTDETEATGDDCQLTVIGELAIARVRIECFGAAQHPDAAIRREFWKLIDDLVTLRELMEKR